MHQEAGESFFNELHAQRPGDLLLHLPPRNKFVPLGPIVL